MNEPVIDVQHYSMFWPNESKEIRNEQVQDFLVEWKVQSIIVRYHHVKWETLMPKVQFVVQHVKGLGHHSLSDSNRHTHYESVDPHYLAWIFILFINILQGSIGEEYM